LGSQGLSLSETAITINVLTANAIAFSISTVVNYFLCAFWVFSGANRQSKAAMAAFLMTSIIGLCLNEALMFLLVGVLGMKNDTERLIAKVITALLVMIWNYFTKRLVLTYQKRRSASTDVPDEKELPA